MGIPRDGFAKTMRRAYDYIDGLTLKSYSTIPSNLTTTIASGEQMVVYDSMTIDGTLSVTGELRVVAWPS